MFDSMHMHMPVVIAMIALILVAVAGGLFVAVRIAGQRAYNDDAPTPGRRPGDDG